jgi:hypothetical protein
MANRNLQLTEEHVPYASIRQLVLVLVGAVVLFVALNQAVRELTLARTSNRGYWLVREKWDRLLALKAPVDWLVLGDSSGNQGVRPDTLAELGFGRAFNSCIAGNMLLVNDAWMLEQYLAHHGPPKGVILVHVLDIWARDRMPPGLLARVPLPWGHWKHGSPPLALDRSDEWDVFLARYVPLYAENKTLESWVLHPSTLLSQQFHLRDDGFMPLDSPNPERVRRDSRRHAAWAKNRRFEMSKLNRVALGQIQALANEHRVHVYLASSPISEALWKNRDTRRYVKEMGKSLRRAMSKSAYTHYVFDEPITFPDTEMENADHLTTKAAVRYTRLLAEAVRRVQEPEE